MEEEDTEMRKTPQPTQTSILQNATAELSKLDIELQEWDLHISDLQESLHKLSERAASRAQRLQDVQKTLSDCQEARADAATFKSIAANTEKAVQASQAYNVADHAVKDAISKLNQIASINNAEALKDGPEQQKLETALASSKEIMSMKREEHDRLVLARTVALCAHGEQERVTLERGFVALLDQEEAAREALQGIARQRQSLVEQSKERLAEFPQLLSELLQQYGPAYSDPACEIMESCIAYRQTLAKHSAELLGIMENAGIAHAWIREFVLSEGQFYYHKNVIAAIEQHLTRYREEHR